MIIKPRRCPECKAVAVFPMIYRDEKDYVSILEFQCDSCGWYSKYSDKEIVVRDDWVKEWLE